MKTTLKTLLFSSAVYAVGFLFVVLYRWEFFNPFLWVLDVPHWDGTSRIGILICIAAFQTANVLLLMELPPEPSGEEEKKKYASWKEGKIAFAAVGYILVLCIYPLIMTHEYCPTC